MDKGPQVILHSNHLIAQPDENIGQHGTIVYVLMTDVVEHNGTDVAPNVDLDLISTPPSPGSSRDGYLPIGGDMPLIDDKAMDLASLARGVTPVVPPEAEAHRGSPVKVEERGERAAARVMLSRLDAKQSDRSAMTLPKAMPHGRHVLQRRWLPRGRGHLALVPPAANLQRLQRLRQRAPTLRQ
jgi:hypothetical protein